LHRERAMPQMRVPKQFELFADTIRVVRRSPDHFHSNCTYGDWDHDNAVIAINRNTPRRHELPTFLHEFFHAAFDALGYSAQSADERLVEGLAQLTAQMMKTAK
jgi:Zn-dependent peptidase ImmA (M78 family)